MDMWTAIVAIVAIVFIAEIFKGKVSNKKKKEAQEVSAARSAKIDELERRIQSLETIIIDYDRDRKYRDLK
ncbi:MAG: hypothetical protein MI748_04425 [Opitutales bacterium]|nr:hypothetical protein [Opitutales bacterium]